MIFATSRSLPRICRKRAISFSVSRVLLDDLVALETGEALEAHVEDGLRLDLREAELGHQALARGRRLGSRRG